MDYYLAAIIAGLCLSLMSMGIFISMKIFNIPDITTDGSYTLGAAITAVVIMYPANYWVALPMVMICGAIAGAATGFIHTRLKIDALLSGILVMTALYSINLKIMGRSNIPLTEKTNIFSLLGAVAYHELWVVLFVVVCFSALIVFLLKTDFGIAMRATGNSLTMARAMGVNVDMMRIIGLSIANSMTATSGFLIAQYQGFADINMGIGIVIVGLGSVLMADALIKSLGITSVVAQIAFVVAGSVLFRLVLAFALSLGLDPTLLKLVTAVFVLLIVALSSVKRSKYA